MSHMDQETVGAWLAKRRQDGRWWAAAWLLLILIPGLLAVLVAGFILADDKNTLLDATVAIWIFTLIAACLAGLFMELIHPTRPWTRWAFIGSLVSGGVGVMGNMLGQEWADPFIFPLIAAALCAFGIFLLRILDRGKLVRPSKVRRDLEAGEIWIFGAPESIALKVLPLSRLVLPAAEGATPPPFPALIQMAAPIPEHRWEIPAHHLTSNNTDTRLFMRAMEEAEWTEAHTLVRAYSRRGIVGISFLGILGVGLSLNLVRELSFEGLANVTLGEWLGAAWFSVLFLWGAPRYFRLRNRLRADLKGRQLVVVRRTDEPQTASPLAEILPTSRVLWSQGGRVGPFRRKYLKRTK